MDPCKILTTLPGCAVDKTLKSHQSAEFTLRKIPIHVCEMEDVLFHLDSAVMMPSKPEGSSSHDGEKQADSGTSEKQDKISGLQAIALILKHAVYNPTQRMLVAGHADTSGKPDYNFELSGLRAQNVLYLLTGESNGDPWIDICTQRHRIEDYQQILKHYAVYDDRDYDPGKVDNSWGPATEHACQVFFETHDPDNAAAMLEKVKNDRDHKWPREAWALVYRRYNAEIADELKLKPGELDNLRQLGLKFIDDKRRFVGCGESFPIDKAEKNNYRSQQNRRVEVLFIDEVDIGNGAPWPVIDCPTVTSRNHKPEECPLFNEFYAKVYVDPGDLYAEQYYLQFVYFDHIANKVCVVPDIALPDRIRIRACYFREKPIADPLGNNIEVVEIPTVSTMENGVVTVKVQFRRDEHALDGKDPKNFDGFHFRFDYLTDGRPAPDRDAVTADTENEESLYHWIYTDSPSATPAMVIKSMKEYNALPFAERWKHYDFPQHWNSAFYWTRTDATPDKIGKGTDTGDQFKEVLRNKLKPRPFGTVVARRDKPMTFCLDDIILTFNSLGPIFNGGAVSNADGTVEGAFLDKQYKVVNPDTSNQKSYRTAGGIKGKHFPFRGQHYAAILRDRLLFGIFNDRVNKSYFEAGHRAAVFMHKTKMLTVTNFCQSHTRGTIGNYDCFLLRDQRLENGEQVAYIFNYFRWHFKEPPTPAPTIKEPNPKPYSPPTQQWINEAITNITNEWNNAADPISLFHATGTEKYRIFVKYFIEHVANGFQHTIVEVFPAGTEGRSFMSPHLSNVRADQHQHDPKNQTFVCAHEFGHATSLDDEYHEKWTSCSYGFTGFVDFKPGSPYENDFDKKVKKKYEPDVSMMRDNNFIRSRYYWHYAVWMRTAFLAGQKIPFRIIKKGDPDYAIIHNEADTWDPRVSSTAAAHYYNRPYLSLLNQQNAKTSKGNFNVHLYPLGEDDFSKNGILKGQAFTGILVVAIKIRFSFHAKAKLTDIYCFLRDIDKSIKEHFRLNHTIQLVGDKPFQKTFIRLFPQYLVDECPEPDKYSTYFDKDTDTAAKYSAAHSSIISDPANAPHYRVRVRTSGANEWDPTDSKLLHFDIDDEDEFWEFVSEMLGLGRAQVWTKANFSLNGLGSINGTIENL